MANHSTLDYQQAPRDHLCVHFTRMSGYRDEDVPIIVRGEGCYLEDSNGKRYLVHAWNARRDRADRADRGDRAHRGRTDAAGVDDRSDLGRQGDGAK